MDFSFAQDVVGQTGVGERCRQIGTQFSSEFNDGLCRGA